MTRNCPGAVPLALLPRAGVRALALAVVTLVAGGCLPVLAQNDAATSSSSSAPAHVHKKKTAATSTSSSSAGEREAASYSIGLLMGTQLHQSGITSESLSSQEFLKGFRAAIGGSAKPTPQDQQRAVGLLQQARAAQAAKNAVLAKSNEEAARKFLAENAKQPGVQTTASGIEYKVIKPGAGDSPKLTDEVLVNYRGTLLDGTEFDSSYKRGQPATFPLSNVIRGWQESLMLMKPGAQYEIWIPPNLAYGDNSPPPIPPGSVLKFEVNLLSAKPAATVGQRPLGGAGRPSIGGAGAGGAPQGGGSSH